MGPSSDTTYSVSLPQIESFRFLFSGGVNSKTGLSKGFPGGSVVKILPAVRETRETQVWSLGWEDCLEEGLVTHSIIRAWRIPWTEEPGRLWSMGSQRVGHDWSDLSMIFLRGKFECLKKVLSVIAFYIKPSSVLAWWFPSSFSCSTPPLASSSWLVPCRRVNLLWLLLGLLYVPFFFFCSSVPPYLSILVFFIF